MRYREITEATFISSDRALSAIVKGTRAEARLGHTRAEAYLEEYRPKGCLPRSQSILLSSKPNGEYPFSYRVTPIDQVNRYHTGWLALLADIDPSQDGISIGHYANSFWQGDECLERPEEPWESRTSAVRIEKRVGRSAGDLF